jgi:hemolysin activation/secretion protein
MMTKMKKTYLNMTKSALLVSCLVAAMPLSAYAVDTPQGVSAPPDAGMLLGQLEPKRHITPIPKKPKVTVTVPQHETVKQQMKARIDKVVFKCDSLDANTMLQPVIADKLHKEMTFNDMLELADYSMRHLRRFGYGVAFVYPPAQDITKNTLQLNVVIGRYGDLDIKNTSSLANSRLLSYTGKSMRPGALINTNNLEQTMLILNDIPGVEARAALEPGKRPGTSKLVINVHDLEKSGGYVYVDDYGSKASGRFRLGLDYHINNVTHEGDQFDVALLGSTASMRNYLLRYSHPVGNYGAMGRVVFSHMNYRLGDKFDFMNGDGLANTLELGISAPMYRTMNHSTFLDFAYRHRALSDGLFDGQLDTKKSSDSMQMEMHGYARAKNDSISYSLSHTFGNLGLDSTFAEIQDTALKSEGWYNKSNSLLYYIHQFDNRWQLHTSFNGQIGWKNLDSSEDFYIGGADGVRAFPEGETGGDSGMIGTIEFRYQTGLPGLQLTAFADAGRVFYNTHNEEFTGENVRNLAGVGLGFIYNKYRDWYAKFDWATPWGNHYSNSEGSTIHNTYWFRLVKQF